MRNKLIDLVDSSQIRTDHPEFKIGQNVKVNVRIKEGSKERIQVFEGLIISIKGQGATQTFTVRKISYGVGVERTFLVHSPLISSIEVLRTNKIRRSKLYYMRELSGKATRLKEVIKSSKVEKKSVKKV